MDADIEQLAVAWRIKVERALIAYENDQKYKHSLPPLPPTVQAVVVVKPSDLIKLLNWRVWCMRYVIGPRFIIETLLGYHHRHRRPSFNPSIVTFGVRLATLTGVPARHHVEEAVLQRYPNGENVYMARHPQPPPIHILRYQNDSDMIRQYRAAIANRHHEMEHQQSLVRRPYRGC